MRRIVHTVATAVVIVASNTGDTACENTNTGSGGTAKACWVDTRGIKVQAGLVEDVVTASCDARPNAHEMTAWLEINREDGWHQVGDTRQSFRVPGPKSPATLRVEGICQPGQWRTAWRTYGESPNGSPFDYTDSDFFGTRISAEDCWGE